MAQCLRDKKKTGLRGGKIVRSMGDFVQRGEYFFHILWQNEPIF